MIVLARLLARVVSFVVLLALALVGVALAVFCIGTGTDGPSLAHLASLLELASFRDTTGAWLSASRRRVRWPRSPGCVGLARFCSACCCWSDCWCRDGSAWSPSRTTRKAPSRRVGDRWRR